MSGPSRHNFSDIYGVLDAAGAVATVKAADDIAATALRLLTDEAEREAAHHAADGALAAMGGALDKTVEALLPLLPAMEQQPAPVAVPRPETVSETADQGFRRAVS
jgi:3-deoxy-D-manno-octulosonic-acid transferase